jgi:hypothetical protein
MDILLNGFGVSDGCLPKAHNPPFGLGEKTLQLHAHVIGLMRRTNFPAGCNRSRQASEYQETA